MGLDALKKDDLKVVCEEYLLDPDSYMPFIMNFFAAFVINFVNNIINFAL
jgi:hypothetical protein